MIIFEYTNYERLLDTFTKDALILAEKQVFDLFDAYFAKAEYHRILDLGKDRFVLILAAGSPNMLPAQIKTVLSDIELKMNIELIASIGCAVPTIKYIDRSFSEAAYVSHQRIFQIQNSSVCRLEDIRSAQDESLYHSTESETAVIQNIIDGNKDAAMRLLDIQLRDNFPNGITSKERLAQFGLDFSAMIMRVILGIHCRPEEVFPEGTNILRELRECSDVPRLRTKIEWILDSIIAHLEAQKNTLDDQIKENMTTFVKENYTKDISLYDLANYLNVSLVHASRLFKKLVGENFKDYLSYFRFQKAKKLMDQYPTRKLQDIAELTGFSNRDALKRMFLKHEGVTPSEYLKNK